MLSKSCQILPGDNGICVLQYQFIAENITSYVTATTYSAQYGGQLASYTVDGNSNTRWAYFTGPGWVRWDLGVGRYVSQVDLFDIVSSAGSIATAQPRDFVIQGSNDDSIWDDLLTVTGKVTWSTTGFEEFVLDNPGTYRYVRVYITLTNYGGGTNQRGSIHEAKVWGTP
jgi:hypothetical protein